MDKVVSIKKGQNLGVGQATREGRQKEEEMLTSTAPLTSVLGLNSKNAGARPNHHPRDKKLRGIERKG